MGEEGLPPLLFPDPLSVCPFQRSSLEWQIEVCLRLGSESLLGLCSGPYFPGQMYKRAACPGSLWVGAAQGSTGADLKGDWGVGGLSKSSLSLHPSSCLGEKVQRKFREQDQGSPCSRRGQCPCPLPSSPLESFPDWFCQPDTNLHISGQRGS